MRTIKAKDIKRGMTIEWYSYGLTKRAVVKDVNLFPWYENVRVKVDEDYAHLLDYNCDVVVVLEAPKIIQPPEPTALGARVMVNGMKLVRLRNDNFPWYYFGDHSFGITWKDLWEEGQVIVVDADPWWPTE